MTTTSIPVQSRATLEAMPAGPTMRAALVRSGLWDPADERDPMTEPAAALCVRAAIARRPANWDAYYHEFRREAGDHASWVSHAELEQAWKVLPPLTICRNALLACLPADDVA